VNLFVGIEFLRNRYDKRYTAVLDASETLFRHHDLWLEGRDHTDCDSSSVGNRPLSFIRRLKELEEMAFQKSIRF